MKTIRRPQSSSRRPALRRKTASAVRTAPPPPAETAAPAARPDKLDLTKQFKAEYIAPHDPVLINTTPARYLTIGGEGEPGGTVFQARIGALYAMAFTTKMTRKAAGQRDYTIARLEARYLNAAADPMPPKQQWQWELLIRTPDFVTARELSHSADLLHERGQGADASMVALETIDEGHCVQMLHVGPYDRISEALARMQRFAKEQGYRVAGVPHEVYLNDPRRVPPERLRTILRLPVAPVD